eukprot:m.45940 g.45940  ORF g.45940 m.45940 type:complete len:617 (-) comp8698_c0_seq2:140-1990(-)
MLSLTARWARGARGLAGQVRMLASRPTAENPGELARALGQCSTQALVDALWMEGYPPAMIEGSRPLDSTNAKLAGVAVTLRFVPHRPDIVKDKPAGEESPEYVAFEKCGPDQVLVMSSIGPWESVGGDIKFLRLKQRGVAGLVTDGSVRDTGALLGYGFPVFSHSTTANQGPAAMQPWAVDDVVMVGGVAVRPGDYLVGDQDGVVVIPSTMAEDVLRLAHEREEVEDVIKEELTANPGPPGKYYPFRKPVAEASPLGHLLTTRGISHHFAQTRSLQTSAASAAPPPLERLERMKAVVVSEPGDTSVLEVKEVFRPYDLKDGEVLVRNAHAGVNFIDTYHRSGLYKRDLPFILGQEGAGEIYQSTPAAEAEGFFIGTPVAYSVLGTYCEFTVVPTRALLRVSEGLDLKAACTIPVQGLTAHYLIHDAHRGAVQPGDWMLIHAAAGGTGQIAVQLAKRAGYNVIGSASSAKLELCHSIGCDAVIDYGNEDVAARVMEITGGVGASAVLDGVGKSTYQASLASLARRGVCVFFGNASGPVPPIAPLELVAKSAFITRPKLNDYTTTREELDYRANDVFAALADGDLEIKIDTTFPLDDVQEAHRYLEAGRTTGKVLLTV